MPSLLFYAASHHNILPLTSRCNLNCLFCSHRQNPPHIDIYSLPEREPSEIFESFPFLSPRKKIIIGESATRILEGEPFSYPYAGEVLQELRRFFPHTPLQITTNGTLLKESILMALKEMEPLELMVSLNIKSPALRESLLGDRYPNRVLDNIKGLGELGITFHGSVVALPHLTGWQELEETLFFLEEEGARTLRLFLPGFTRLAPSSLIFDLSLWKELEAFTDNFQANIKAPLLLEPPLLEDCTPRVEGTIKEAYGDKAGLQRGDVILAIGDKKVKSRAEAFHRASKKKSPLVTFSRQGVEKKIRLTKKEGEPPGFVMYQDMEEAQRERFLRAIARYRHERTLVMTSSLAFPLIRGLVEEVINRGDPVEVVPVPSLLFQGSIMSAGLLVVEDFLEVIKAKKFKPRVIIVPEKPFNFKGKDLLGHSYLRLQEETGAQLILI